MQTVLKPRAGHLSGVDSFLGRSRHAGLRRPDAKEAEDMTGKVFFVTYGGTEQKERLRHA